MVGALQSTEEAEEATGPRIFPAMSCFRERRQSLVRDGYLL